MMISAHGEKGGLSFPDETGKVRELRAGYSKSGDFKSDGNITETFDGLSCAMTDHAEVQYTGCTFGNSECEGSHALLETAAALFPDRGGKVSGAQPLQSSRVWAASEPP